MKEDETVRTAKRELARLSDEGGLSASPALKSRVASVRAHFAAEDADQADMAELWGTRIARGLAVIAFVGLCGWLYVRYFQ